MLSILKKVALLYILLAAILQIVMLYHWLADLVGFTLYSAGGFTAAVGLGFSVLFVVAWIVKRLDLDFDIPIIVIKS